MNRKINFPWWFIVILLAAFAVGYFVWTESLRDDSSLILNSPFPSFEKRGEGGEFEGWKTYRNEEYGFEMRYPSDWIATPSSNPVVLFYQKKQLGDDVVNENRITLSKLGNINSWPETMGEAFRDSIERNTNFLVGGEKAVRQVSSDRSLNYSEYIQFIHNGDAFSISFVWVLSGNAEVAGRVSNKTKMLEQYNQILSTFQFIE